MKCFVPFRDHIFTAFVPFGLVEEWFGWLAEETGLWKFADFSVPKRRINITSCPPFELLGERLTAKYPEVFRVYLRFRPSMGVFEAGNSSPFLAGWDWLEGGDCHLKREQVLFPTAAWASSKWVTQDNAHGLTTWLQLDCSFCDVFACTNKR